MADVNTALAATRGAVSDLIAAAEKTGTGWAVPRAPGKWSPSQVVEHVAIVLEESANFAAGAPTRFPSLPVFLRPLIRAVFFNRVLKNQEFPKSRTAKSLNPASGPRTPAAARARLDAAFARFDQECRVAAAEGRKVTSPIFGPVSVEDLARFQEIHTRHHRAQIPDAT